MNKNLTTEKFIKKCNEIHLNYYDYSKTEYIKTNLQVIITCPKHGDFQQSANSHLKGHSCLLCAKEKRIKHNTYLFSEFIDKSNKTHNNKYKYVYDTTSYINLKSDVEIICPIHGIFTQKGYNHINGSGCLKCNNSRGEEKVLAFLLLHYPKIKYIEQFRISWLGKLSYDFYLPDLKIAIEYQGIQHYEPIDIFGGDITFKKQIKRDVKKKTLSKLNNVLLVKIKYNNEKKDMENLIKIIANHNKIKL